MNRNKEQGVYCIAYYGEPIFNSLMSFLTSQYLQINPLAMRKIKIMIDYFILFNLEGAFVFIARRSYVLRVKLTVLSPDLRLLHRISYSF